MEPFATSGSSELPYFEILSWNLKHQEVVAGFSSRRGGVGVAPFESMNLALHVNDQQSHVIENRRLLADQLGFPFEAWTCAEQVHGKQIYIVTNTDKGRGRERREDAIQNMDGLITNQRGILLTAFYADCVPLYFYDPLGQVVGIAHAGWKGTALDIAGEMIRVMTNQFGSKADQILTAIGPSIGGCCYEVDSAVIDKINEKWDGPDENKAIESKQNGKFMLDLRECNRHFLLKEGILPYHIEITRRCTSCQSDLFFSHRKEKGKTGRMAAWIGLRSEKTVDIT
jgi:YfiH family protein